MPSTNSKMALSSLEDPDKFWKRLSATFGRFPDNGEPGMNFNFFNIFFLIFSFF